MTRGHLRGKSWAMCPQEPAALSLAVALDESHSECWAVRLEGPVSLYEGPSGTSIKFGLVGN